MKRHQTFISNLSFYQELAAKVPPGGLLFNAPRELWGDITWYGDFCHGSFYAVVLTDNPDRARMIANNLELDAWLLTFITPEVAQERVRERLATMNYKAIAPEIFERCWVDSFYATLTIREIQPADLA